MDLRHDERTFAHLTFSDLPDNAAVEVQFEDNGTWYPTTGTSGVRSILIAGPDIAQEDALYVVTTDVAVWARVNDNPEVLPRRAGNIYLID